MLHFVSLPGGDQDASQDTQLILASRTEPTPAVSQGQGKGVQQIVVLPEANKALILCNSTLTFHSLPELSPAQGAPRPVPNCLWVGGVDLDGDQIPPGERAEADVMMALRSKMRLLTVGNRISHRPLDYPGCLAAARRSRYACVADSRSYALVDLQNQQKIPLFPISSLDDTAISVADRQTQTSLAPESTAERQGYGALVAAQLRSPSSGRLRGESQTTDRGHGRNRSLGAFVSGITSRQSDRPRSQGEPGLHTPETRSGAVSPVRPGSSIGAHDPRDASPNRPLPPLPGETPDERAPSTSHEPTEFLQPHVLSSISTEFLLFTGTSRKDPGVGIFVNLEGDVVRGTLEFSQYPVKVVSDGGQSMESSSHGTLDSGSDGFVLAAIEGEASDAHKRGLEIQRWDVTGAPRAFLELPSSAETSTGNRHPTIGVSMAKTRGEFQLSEIGKSLRSKRLHFRNSSKESTVTEGQTDTTEKEEARDSQEDEFASLLGQVQTRLLTWCDDRIFWTVRNPILLQIESAVQQVLDDCKDSRLDQGQLIRIMKSLRDHDARSETEFLSLEYVRQKISIILFADLAVNRDDVNAQLDERLLMEAGADPRLLLSMIPFLHKDIFEGPSGVWANAGLVDLMQDQFSGTTISLEPDEVLTRPEDFDILGLVKRYLTAWRQRKGFGSIPDETHVFATVDAALLHVLLLQDQQSHLGPGSSSTIRAELYAIADNPVNCFERAAELLEEYRRLYVLSRLYQSRRMVRKVLETWRRILEGAPDDGGGFTDGENEVRRYLVNRSDRSLVEEYGTWLARRNPQLGVQIFSDDNAKVKFPPDYVVNLLRQTAPDAVKVYLEHLVFGKKRLQYADNLISYYLDSVLSTLSYNPDALSLLSSSYKDYRSLPAPKATYREFITSNSINETWWHDRLRLLELLGGSHGTGFTYDVSAVLEQIKPYEQALVPESIILEGQQGHHAQALRLLTHGLGDYHTAINYCLLGGASIFHPATPGSYQDSTSNTISLPSHDEQAALFSTLLPNFLSIQIPSERLERTSDLLSRFGPWFDLQTVLDLIPDEWAIEAVAAFLASALRRDVAERNQSMVVKALSGAENLRVTVEMVEKIEGLGPTVVPALETPESGSGWAGG